MRLLLHTLRFSRTLVHSAAFAAPSSVPDRGSTSFESSLFFKVQCVNRVARADSDATHIASALASRYSVRMRTSFRWRGFVAQKLKIPAETILLVVQVKISLGEVLLLEAMQCIIGERERPNRAMMVYTIVICILHAIATFL